MNFKSESYSTFYRTQCMFVENFRKDSNKRQMHATYLKSIKKQKSKDVTNVAKSEKVKNQLNMNLCLNDNQLMVV